MEEGERLKNSSYCKPCRAIYAKAYQRKKRGYNPILVTPEMLEERRQKKLKRVREYVKNKRKTDVNYRISESIRKRILIALRKGIKTSSSWDLLGCQPAEYVKYLETKFKPEMNWDNYGSYWEIDHIVPCSHFNLINCEEQKKCFHYLNTQPLAKDKNRIKGNRFVG